MKVRETCSCNAETTVKARTMEEVVPLLQQWRDHHSRRCPNSPRGGRSPMDYVIGGPTATGPTLTSGGWTSPSWSIHAGLSPEITGDDQPRNSFYDIETDEEAPTNDRTIDPDDPPS